MAYNNTEALKMKELGNQAYKNKEYSQAINYYSKAIQLNPQDSNFYSNRALCYFNMENFIDCVADCNRAINLNPAFVKAYKKKASALANQLKFTEAVQAMKDAVNCERDNIAVKNELEEYESYESNYNRYLEA